MSARWKEKIKYDYLYKNESTTYGKAFHAKKHLSYIENIPMNSLIDVGCGDGAFCKWAYGHGVKKVYGVDISSTPVGGPRISWMEAFAHDINLPDQCVDYVTAFDVMEHLLPDDVPTAFKEFRRLARVGLIATISSDDSIMTVFGKSLHPTIENIGFWMKHLKEYGDVKRIGNFYHVVYSNVVEP